MSQCLSSHRVLTGLSRSAFGPGDFCYRRPELGHTIRLIGDICFISAIPARPAVAHPGGDGDMTRFAKRIGIVSPALTGTLGTRRILPSEESIMSRGGMPAVRGDMKRVHVPRTVSRDADTLLTDAHVLL